MIRHEKEWDKEYKTGRLVTGGDKPQAVVLRFLKWLRKTEKVDVSSGDFAVLDLGSGTGRNANYLAELGAKVAGMELSETAISIAQERADYARLCNNTPGSPACASHADRLRRLAMTTCTESLVEYIHASIGKKYAFKDKSFDLILDITSSNSLNEQEREVYVQESSRVLKQNGHMLVRALCKDGDKNAKQLIKDFPGGEKDTYILPGVGITERVFTKEDITELYSKYFKIIEIKKESHYARMQNCVFKRNYWILYLTTKLK